MNDELNKHFCLGMASAYKHVAEHIESRKHCKPTTPMSLLKGAELWDRDV